MRRFPSLTVVRTELRPWWRTRPLRGIALGWFLAILITVLLLLVPTPFPIWGYLVFPIAWVSDGISTTRVLATVAFDVLTLLGVIAALVSSPWISAGSRRPAPGSRAGAGELLLAAWARSLAAWTPVAPLLIAATALGGATWSALILLLIFLTALTGAWCGIGLGAAALVRGGAGAGPGRRRPARTGRADRLADERRRPPAAHGHLDPARHQPRRGSLRCRAPLDPHEPVGDVRHRRRRRPGPHRRRGADEPGDRAHVVRLPGHGTDPGRHRTRALRPARTPVRGPRPSRRRGRRAGRRRTVGAAGAGSNSTDIPTSVWPPSAFPGREANTIVDIRRVAASAAPSPTSQEPP